MKKVLLLILAILPAMLGTSKLIAYTPPDSCLKLICPNDSTVVWDSIQVSYRRVPPWNPDSVRVDSCPESPTYLSKYAKGYFELNFKSYPFNSAIPKDSIWLVSQLKDSTTKAQFQQLELLFGKCYFFRNIKNDLPDSTTIKWADVFIAFDLYQNVDSVISFLNNNVDSLFLSSYYDRWLIEEMLVDIDENHLISKIILTPNPASDYIEISGVVGEVKLYDVLGIEHPATAWHPSTEGNVRIDISALPKGVYFVSVGGQMYKFMKM